ncbi:MAG: type II toxin-antitoxin system RelE/ParE family toxin [Campylobacterota bacterium]
MILKLHPLAEAELKIALDYYYAISPKLEANFLFTLDNAFSNIKQSPNLYPHETKTAQKVVMEKFPYIVLYEKYENIIMILAIFHTRQDSEKLTNRDRE